jgi:hypothetical protein
MKGKSTLVVNRSCKRYYVVVNYILLIAFMGITIFVHGAGGFPLGAALFLIWFGRVPIPIAIAWLGIISLLFGLMSRRRAVVFLADGLWMLFVAASVLIIIRTNGFQNVYLPSLVVFFGVLLIRAFILLRQLPRSRLAWRFGLSDAMCLLTFLAIDCAVLFRLTDFRLQSAW